MYHRQPHPDLPVIPEEGCGTPASSDRGSDSDRGSPSDHDDDDDEEPTLDEIDIHGVDDDTSCSNAEGSIHSHAANSLCSYAFTLDGVGFDEENSLVGSVVGSVAGIAASASGGGGVMTMTGGSLTHTPPTRYSPERISRHERNLHRETCRTLGLPYSEAESLSSGSPSSGTKESVSPSSGSASPSALSATDREELLRRQKIERMWPWPTSSAKVAGKRKESSATEGVPLDKKMMRNVNDASGAKRKSAWSTYAGQWKEAVESFSERIEDAYQRAKAQQGDAGAGDAGEQRQRETSWNEKSGSAKKEDSTGMLVPYDGKTEEKRSSESARRGRFGPRWVADSYGRANPLARLTVGATVLLFLLCVVVILATVSQSRARSTTAPSPSSAGYVDGGGSGAMTYHDLDRFADKLNEIDDDGDGDSIDGDNAVVDVDGTGLAHAPSEWIASARNTTKTTLTPSYEPTEMPTAGPSTKPSPSPLEPPRDTSCLDMEGQKFRNGRGKMRECHWLTKNGNNNNNDGNTGDGDGATLRSPRLAAECGATALISELGLNCRHSCRAYNGCLLKPSTGGGSSKKEKKEKKEYQKDQQGEKEAGGGTEEEAAAGGGATGVVGEMAAGGEKELERVPPAPETEFPTDSGWYAVLTRRPSAGPMTRPTVMPSMKPTAIPTIRRTVAPTSKPSVAPTSKPTTRPSGGPVEAAEPAEETTDAEAATDIGEAAESTTTFADSRGRERECWWLDLRNVNQKRIRRDANCVREAVRAACPTSCADYPAEEVAAMVAKGGALGNESTTVGHESGRDGKNGTAVVPSAPPAPLPQIDGSDVPPADETEPPRSQPHEGLEFRHHHDPLPQDACHDGGGYYLNDRDHPELCSWLRGSDDDDPTDYARRIHNCGYNGGASTDLGRMCREACGMCGLR